MGKGGWRIRACLRVCSREAAKQNNQTGSTNGSPLPTAQPWRPCAHEGSRHIYTPKLDRAQGGGEIQAPPRSDYRSHRFRCQNGTRAALENGWADERRIAARGEMRRPELREQRRMTMPVQRRCYHRGHTRNGPRAGFKAAAHRVLAFRATGVLRCIRVRIPCGLAICRHQGGDSREGDDRALQSDSEHHDDSDELALHDQNSNTQPASALPKRILPPPRCG